MCDLLIAISCRQNSYICNLLIIIALLVVVESSRYFQILEEIAVVVVAILVKECKAYRKKTRSTVVTVSQLVKKFTQKTRISSSWG